MTASGQGCPLCEGPLSVARVRARDLLVTGEGPFDVRECVACELGVTIPQLSDAELARFYPPGYYEEFYDHADAGGGPLYRLRARYRRWAAERRHNHPPFDLPGVTPGRALDVGCGSGELLEHLGARGWETYGVDPGEASVAAASKRADHVHHGTLEDHPWDAESFQLVTFQHSLEHIVDPLSVLRRARDLLAPGGLLVVAVPNWSCWRGRAIFRSRWFSFDLPRHQQHFSPRSLRLAGEALDLRVGELAATTSAISTAYSLHYVLAGRWRPGWRLWLSYALAVPLLPFALLVDRFGGGDCCHVVLERSG